MSNQTPAATREHTMPSTEPLLALINYVELRPSLDAILRFALSNSLTSQEGQIQRFFNLYTSNFDLSNAIARAYSIITILLRFEPVHGYISYLFNTFFWSKWQATLRFGTNTPEFRNIMAYVRRKRPAHGDIAVNSSCSRSAEVDNYCPQGLFSFLEFGALIMVNAGCQNDRVHKGKVAVTVFRTRPQKALQDFLDLCKDSAKSDLKNQDEGKITLYTLDQSSESDALKWSNKRVSARSMDTVYLPDEKKKKILEEVKRFWTPKYKAEMKLISKAYHHGFLFHGKPGTGKTSMARAMAAEYDVPIAILPLASPSLNDDNISSVLHSLPDKGILLLEDIDCSHDGRRSHTAEDRGLNNGQEEAKASNVSHSALLNAIDGVSAVEGHVLIVTTNFPDVLEKTLIRAGRCDTSIEFGYITRTDSVRLYLRTYLRRNYLDENMWGISLKSIATTIFSPEKAKEIADELVNSSGFLEENILAEYNTPSSEDAAKITKMGHYFASKVPEEKLSPAQIEGFLETPEFLECPLKAIRQIEGFVKKNRSDRSRYLLARPKL